ncbi:MAG: SPOR domain-containing protein, partial [Treponema sp.]|nr:SPOR domain-containing protein [Treponema sp.]
SGIETEPAVVAEESAVEAEEEDMYQPIVLIPSESNPPVAAEKTEPVEEKKVEEPVKLESVEAEAVAVEKESAPAEAAKPVKVLVSNEWTNYVVPSLKNLRSGFYYVQVASLVNYDNIKSFVDKYSAKYPVVLVQNSSKSAYQVMVGPLNIDEYGSVGEKFKAYGFKDSFVRKIR